MDTATKVKEQEIPYSPSQIPGWGIDADPENDPTYPMKRRNNAEHAGYTWERPTQQAADVEVLHSNERPSLSSVFGNATPPSGLSGMLRRFAFKYSESSYGHWLPLMLADRINVVEGRIEDLLRGRVPNTFTERGWRVEWKHNRPALMRKVAIRGILVGAAVAAVIILTKKNQRAVRASGVLKQRRCACKATACKAT